MAQTTDIIAQNLTFTSANIGPTAAVNVKAGIADGTYTADWIVPIEFNAVLEYQFEQSTDGGQTWEAVHTSYAPGGGKTGTDLVIGPSNREVSSASVYFPTLSVGGQIVITGGTGWKTGTYNIIAVSNSVITLDTSPGQVGRTGGAFEFHRHVITGGAITKNVPGAKVRVNFTNIVGTWVLKTLSVTT